MTIYPLDHACSPEGWVSATLFLLTRKIAGDQPGPLPYRGAGGRRRGGFFVSSAATEADRWLSPRCLAVLKHARQQHGTLRMLLNCKRAQPKRNTSCPFKRTIAMIKQGRELPMKFLLPRNQEAETIDDRVLSAFCSLFLQGAVLRQYEVPWYEGRRSLSYPG